MSELAEIREDLDGLRDRVTYLEFSREVDKSRAIEASTAARAADRSVLKANTDWRDVAERLVASNEQIIELLAGHLAACEPARRPENTQSASDKPLT
jgi:hypothetical protein